MSSATDADAAPSAEVPRVSAAPSIPDAANPWLPIPETYEDALARLDVFASDETRAMVRAMDQVELGQFHFGIGLGIRNNWVYPRGSPLAAVMRRLGFDDPDEMSSILITDYWCRLGGGELDLRPIPRGIWVEPVCWGRANVPRSRACSIDASPLRAWRRSLTNNDRKHRRLAYFGQCSHGHVWVSYAGEPWRPPTKRELRGMRRADCRAVRRHRRHPGVPVDGIACG